MILEIIVLIFFLTLILLHLLQDNIIEGATGSVTAKKYQDPGLSKDPLYLATVNAANISYLKDQMDISVDAQGDLAAMQDEITALEAGLKAISDPDTADDLDLGDEEDEDIEFDTEVDTEVDEDDDEDETM